MNITSAQYISFKNKNSSIKTTIDGEEIFVPLDSDNRHYQAILEWAEEDGNEIAAAD